MRIEGAKNPLDNTGVHPESYDICKNMLDMLGYSLSDVENKNVIYVQTICAVRGGIG